MIRSIAVLGAGTMGHGIAYAAAVGGLETRLFDVVTRRARQGQRGVRHDRREGG